MWVIGFSAHRLPLATTPGVTFMPDRSRSPSRLPVESSRPRWRLDLAAGVLLLAGLLAALAVFSHDPADPPGTTVFPPNEQPSNLLGAAGAFVAHELIETVGV